MIPCISSRLISVHNQQILSPCGKCEVCLNNKADARSFQLLRSISCYRYAFMTTLTYNNEHAPILLYRRFSKDVTYLLQCDPTRPDYMRIVNRDCPLTDSFVSTLRNITGIQHGITYVCRYDVTTFLKRLRKYINKLFPDEKIFYYLVSEYGPSTFRAHYHLVFLTNSVQVAEILSIAVNSCWYHGFTNTTLLKSSSKAASYVASYVASSSSMPSLYSRCDFLQVFSSHSCHQTLSCYVSSISEIYENPSETFMSTRFFNDGKLLECRPSRSDKYYFFPKIYRFSGLTLDEITNAYKSYKICSEVFQSSNIGYLANRVYDYFFNLSFYGSFHTLSVYNLRYLSQFFHYYINFDYVTPRSTLVGRIASVLSCSRIFMFRICNNNESTYYFRIRQLYNFYNYVLPQSILTNFYQSQVDFFASRPLPDYGSRDYYNIMLAYQSFYNNPELLSDYVHVCGKTDFTHPYSTFRSFDFAYLRSIVSSQIVFSKRSKIKYQNSIHLGL